MCIKKALTIAFHYSLQKSQKIHLKFFAQRQSERDIVRIRCGWFADPTGQIVGVVQIGEQRGRMGAAISIRVCLLERVCVHSWLSW